MDWLLEVIRFLSAEETLSRANETGAIRNALGISWPFGSFYQLLWKPAIQEHPITVL
jgi:hypothetical protein